MRIARITLLAAILVVSGCSAASSSHAAESPTPSSGQPSQVPPAGASGSVDLPASITGPVVAEVARLAGVPIDRVTITSAESVTFPDGGLGCPVPGMNYIQVQVEGFKLVAEAGGKRYDFRGTGPDSFRRCTTPS